jgi:hypothetical protein
MLLGLAFIIGCVLVSFVWTKSRKIDRQILEDHAEGAREVLMPGAGGQNGVESRDYGTLSSHSPK